MAKWTVRRTLVLLSALAATPGAVTAALLCRLMQFPDHPRVAPPSRAGWADVVVESRDGVRCAGWLAAPADGAPVIVMANGNGGSRAGLAEPADRLRALGYGVLVGSLRRHDESEPAPRTFGIDEAQDMLAFVDHVAGRFPRSRIGVLGFSAGAVAGLLAASADARVAAVVTDSAYASFEAVVRHRIAEALGGRAADHVMPFANALAFFTVNRPAEPLRAALSGRPLLLIHGSADDHVPRSSPYLLHAAHPGSELWIVRGAAHTRCYETAPVEWLARVHRFLARSLSMTPVRREAARGAARRP